MHLGVILPHVKLYGGVKRFFELGRHFINKGHRFTVFTPDGAQPDWIKSQVEVKSFGDLNNDCLDALFLTEIGLIDALRSANAKRRIFYHVRQSEPMQKVTKYPEIEVFACSSNIYKHDKTKYNLETFKAIGGVNTQLFRPNPIPRKLNHEPLTIIAYGRLAEKRKGTHLIVKACERLYRNKYNIRLLLFDTHVDANMQKTFEAFSTTVPCDFVINHPIERHFELFQRADIFVAAEKKAGWANTVAEAMACGLPVIATRSATMDILKDGDTGIVIRRNRFAIYRALKKLITQYDLRQKYGINGRKHIEQFDWEVLADKILAHLKN